VGAVRTVPAARALAAIGAGARIVATPYCATPQTLLAGLAERAVAVPGLVLEAGMLLGSHPYAEAVRAGRLGCRSWHLAGPARRLAAEGLVDYLPVRAGDVPDLVSRGVDVALVRVGPPDAAGHCSLGPSASYGRDLIRGSALVLAEVDEGFPLTTGVDVTVHVSQLDHLVDADTPTPVYRPIGPGPQARRIAETVVALLPTGAVVQLGIGVVPEAVAAVLATAGRSGLRFVGMAGAAMAELLGSAAEIDAVEVMGGPELFAAVAGNPRVRMASSRRIHNPAWLAGLPRLVSVCSALQVDLTGQVASESVDGRLLAGIGGSVDFVDGAHRSAGGMRIVALPATTSGGASRIVSQLAAGTPVTLPRHGVDLVVTEFGVARLAGRSLRERAEALIAVADPVHRPALAGSVDERPG
jgi:4-hydroxybutyrate CoA-transferase